MKYKKQVFQLVAWLLCIAIAYGLYSMIKEDQRAYAERVAQLQLQASTLEETENEKLETLTDIYDKLYAEIEARDIVCWGDSAMAGGRTTNLAIALKKVEESNLFSPLEKTFNRVLEQGEYKIPSVNVNNMGISNEGMRQILIRAGVETMEIGERIDIPWDTTPVDVRFMDEEAWSKYDSKKNPDEQLKFSNQRNVSFGKVYIDGIRGSLITTDNWFDSTHPRYAFVRKEEGDTQRVEVGTEIEIESATKYIGDIPIFFFENDSGRSVEGLVSDIGRLVDRYTSMRSDVDEENEDSEQNNMEDDSIASTEPSYDIPFVVICTTLEDSDLDKALRGKFGDRYIRNTGYSSEMTDRTYRKLAQQVYDNLDTQGCYVDIKSKIQQAVQDAEGL